MTQRRIPETRERGVNRDIALLDPLDRASFELAAESICDHCLAIRLEPTLEGSGYACCVPNALALAELAVRFATAGTTSETWRQEAVAHAGASALVVQAERCMRRSGIWPWEYE